MDYEYERVLDVEHMNKCIGGKVKAVISFQEFSSMRKNGKHEGKFLCYFSLPRPCCLDEEHLRKLKSLGLLSTNRPAAVWDEDARKPRKRSVEEVVSRFSRVEKEDVLAIGDVLDADVEEEWVMQAGGPLAHRCKTLIQPNRLIFLTAQRFIQTFLGRNFLALHFRRHDFLNFWYLRRLASPP